MFRTCYGFSLQVISITGFDGIERVKVETIIKQIGASFTDYLDQMNTILVCKRSVPLSSIMILSTFDSFN